MFLVGVFVFTITPKVMNLLMCAGPRQRKG